MPDRKPELGDEPIEPRYVEQMNELAELIDRFFNGDKHGDDRTVGFCLMVFDFVGGPKDGRCNYISNANRADVVKLLREQLKRFERQKH